MHVLIDSNSFAPATAQSGTYILEMLTNTGLVSRSPSFTLNRMQPLLNLNSATQLDKLATDSVNSSSSPPPDGTDDGSTSTSHMPSPRSLAQSPSAGATAAYAVPLSLAGSIILFSAIVCAFQRRKLLHERAVTEEFKSFQDTFCAGRWRRFTLWCVGSAIPTGRNSQTSAGDVEKVAESEDIFTRPYIPQLGAGTGRPRPATREPFHAAASARPTVPAEYFKTSLSPRVPYLPAQSPGVIRVYSSKRESEGLNAAVNDNVVSRYLHPSPAPPDWLTAPPTPMQRAHVRRQVLPVTEHGDIQYIYDGVARRLA